MWSLISSMTLSRWLFLPHWNFQVSNICPSFFLRLAGGLVAKLCPTLATSWTIACQAPLSVGFSRQEYWNGLPFSSPRDLPNPGIEPRSPALQADSLPLSYKGSLMILRLMIRQISISQIIPNYTYPVLYSAIWANWFRNQFKIQWGKKMHIP